MTSESHDPKDDSVLKPIDKSVSEDNPTERIEIDKIQLPEGLGQNNDEDKDSSLFKHEPSFAYEKKALQQSNGKFDAPESPQKDPSKKAATNHESIYDKYKEKIEKAQKEAATVEERKEESKEVRREFRRQQTMKKRQLENELKKIQEKLDEWGDKLDTLASISRFVGLLGATLMAIAFIFFLIRNFGNNKFIVWFALEAADLTSVALLGHVTILDVGLAEPDLGVIKRLKWWIYIVGGLHLIMLIVGFAIMSYSGGFGMGGTRIEQSESLYRIMGVVYIVLVVLTSPVLGYWWYLYRGYRPCYEQYYDKDVSVKEVTVVAKPEEKKKEDKENVNRE